MPLGGHSVPIKGAKHATNSMLGLPEPPRGNGSMGAYAPSTQPKLRRGSVGSHYPTGIPCEAWYPRRAPMGCYAPMRGHSYATQSGQAQHTIKGMGACSHEYGQSHTHGSKLPWNLFPPSGA